MSVSFFENIYKWENNDWVQVENQLNIPLYTLTFLLSDKYILNYIRQKGARAIFQLPLLDENTELSQKYLDPKELLMDLETVKGIIPDLYKSFSLADQNDKLYKGLDSVPVKESKTLQRIEFEIQKLEELYKYCIKNDLRIKFGIDY